MSNKRKHLARQKFNFFRPLKDIAIALFSLVALLQLGFRDTATVRS